MRSLLLIIIHPSVDMCTLVERGECINKKIRPKGHRERGISEWLRKIGHMGRGKEKW